jgi:hypothetical protein
MKIIAELVPETAWCKSLYRLLPKEVWSNIRENVIRENGRKC